MPKSAGKTSHPGAQRSDWGVEPEIFTRTFFEKAYAATAGKPNWDLDRPSQVFAKLVKDGEIKGSVLDVGCGTGDTAIYLAQSGHETWGVDFARSAIQKAKAKAKKHGVDVTFRVADAMKLDQLGRKFDTIIDCGLLHVVLQKDLPKYTRSLASVLSPGGMYYALCFSDREPNWGGPGRVTRKKIRDVFSTDWTVKYVRPARYLHLQDLRRGAKSWLAAVERT